MFKCKLCGSQSAAGESSHQLVLETREKLYPSRAKANKALVLDGVRPDDPGGKGWEIVEEATVCADCASPYEVITKE